jgi:tRNA (guanosine-2'-O-)-methyltransferase
VLFPFSQKYQALDSKGKILGEIPWDEVYQEIFPLLTEDRQAKINKVIKERSFSTLVVLENIYDRGNASAVMRSAEALGYTLFNSIEPGEKFKESQRTTAGADKWVELTRWKDSKSCIQHIKNQNVQLVVTSLQPQSKPISEVDFSKPTALVLGNEKEGASPEMIAAADHCVILPMVGFTQSYNISVAGALCFYHIFQDRMRRLGKAGDLSDQQQKILAAEYALRTIPSAQDILKRKLQG